MLSGFLNNLMEDGIMKKPSTTKPNTEAQRTPRNSRQQKDAWRKYLQSEGFEPEPGSFYDPKTKITYRQTNFIM
jgi:hypothetical protein